MKSLIVIAALLVAAPASAQHLPLSCGGNSPTKIFGCLDTINGQWAMDGHVPVVAQSQPIVIHGWALSCYAKQQPSAWQVFYSGAPNADGQPTLVKLPPTAYQMFMRGHRPDVTPYFGYAPVAKFPCAVTSDLWGYAIEIAAGALPADTDRLIVRFTDPTLTKNQVGANHQQVTVRIVP